MIRSARRGNRAGERAGRHSLGARPLRRARSGERARADLGGLCKAVGGKRVSRPPDPARLLSYVGRDAYKTFCKEGYAVLMPDYRGEWEGCEEHTVYPKAISYANYASAGRHLCYADETARETSWYEWTALARYCVRYLGSLPALQRSVPSV